MTEESLLKRQPDESLEDYLVRIYSNMENYGLDRQSAAALMNENTVRLMMRANGEKTMLNLGNG